MAIESECKFLVIGDDWRKSTRKIKCIQAFLSISKECTTRIRITNRGSFITIKGPSKNLARQEYEYEIPESEAAEMIKLSRYETIEKTRYLVDYQGYEWEVDEFHGANEGLIMAEVEFNEGEDPQKIPRPEWIGQEVSGDARYYNTYIAQNRYKSWK